MELAFERGSSLGNPEADGLHAGTKIQSVFAEELGPLTFVL